MTGANGDERPSDSAKDSPDRTYDPNEVSIWPVYPPGTRLPMAKWSRRKELLVLFILLAVIGGAAALVWWFIDTVRR